MTTTSAPDSRAAALAGLRDISPIILGMAPFGLLAGVAALEAGLPAWGASVYSVFVFAGAAQLAALELLGQGAAWPVVVGTILVINARMMMYSASLATEMAEEPARRRAVTAYLLTDQAYATTMARLAEEPGFVHRFAYYVGGALPLCLAWQVYTVAGTVAGSAIPEDVPIGFAIPLVFAGLLVPAVSDRPTLAAAVSSAVVATAAAGLPANLGLLLAILTGVAVGWSVARGREPVPGGRPA